MEKAGVRTRDIQFFSEKNQKMICVHTRQARDFAKYLEQQPWVSSYETCVLLAVDKLPHVNPVDIRKDYLSAEWATDFLIHTADGQIAIREFANIRDFTKKSTIEKLELSRRYWGMMDIKDWKLIIYGEKIKTEDGEVS